MQIKSTAAAFILASGVVTAQTPSEDGISMITRDRRSNTNEAVSATVPKVHVGALFLRLPQEEIANIRRAFSHDTPVDNKWRVTLSEMDAKQHFERWKALPGATIVDELNVVTTAGFSVELTKLLPDKPNAVLRPIPFLNVLARIDTNDTRRVYLEFTAGVTNRTDTLLPVERFAGAVTLWDRQRVVLPPESEEKGPKSSSGVKLVLVLWPDILFGYDNLVQQPK